MKQVHLTLSVNEVNMVIRALGQFPYNQVYETINNIHAQASEQVKGEAAEWKTNEDNQRNIQ